MVLRSRVATTLCVHVACSPLWLQKVATSDAAAYAKSINALFLETSAKTDSNVQDLFLQISALSGGFSSAATHAPCWACGAHVRMRPPRKRARYPGSPPP